MRSPSDLDAAITKHVATLGTQPELVMLHGDFVLKYSFYFRSRLHKLCCGKGMLYSGIPAIQTASPMVEDFLICY